MNEYIEKYGENAIQAYKKSLRISQSLQKDDSSPLKQQLHLLPKKSLSKRSLKSKKGQSQTRLNHSKSIRNVMKADDDCRKKTSSFIDGSKKLISPSIGSNNMFQTFNKLNLNQGKKKLTITQTSTPKNSTKFQFNLNLNKLHNNVKVQQNRDKLTERIQRSSGKKHMDKCSTSQSKHNEKNKRHYFIQVQNKLQQIISTTKKGVKYMVSGIRQAMDIILGNQQDIKLRKVFLLVKQVIQRLIAMGQKYKSKYSRANDRINSLQMIHQTYISSDIQPSTKHNSEINSLKSSNKKSAQIQTIILNENYQLRKKIHKLQKQLQYFTSQSASLMNVFGKFQQNQGTKGKKVTFQKSPQGRQSNLLSSNKIQKRRSSQNLLYYSPSSNAMINAGEKRLSFDPNFMNINNEMRQKMQASLYSSVGSSVSNNQPTSYQKQQYQNFNYRPSRNQGLEQLSQQQDSDNEE